MSLHYFPLLAGDWLAGEAVSMMTPEQEGAFIHLLCHAWQQSGSVPCSLPDNDRALARLSRLGVRWIKAGAYVKAQFEPIESAPGRLRNTKLWAIYEEAYARHTGKVRAGRNGGFAKAAAMAVPGQDASKPLALLGAGQDSASLPLEQNAANQNQNHSQKKKLLHPVAPGVDDPAFANTWAIYPRRAGGNSKAHAFRAWSARVRAGVDPVDLDAGVQRYAAYIEATGKTGTEYVKQGATFFGPDRHWAEPYTVGAAPSTTKLVPDGDGWFNEVLL